MVILMSNGKQDSDLERFRLQLVSHTALPARTCPSPYQGRFVRGPLPLIWLQEASKCPGKGLHVSIALWYLAGLTRSLDRLKCSYSLLRDFGVNRHSAYRALRQLESANLVSIIRGHGRCPRVSLLKLNEQAQEKR
jgi:hypothetical protein